MLAEGVGEVTRNDVAVAAVSGAKILAFNVGRRPSADARRAHAEIGHYSVVYEVLEEIRGEDEYALSPTPDGELVGKAEIRQIFEIGKLGKVAGSMISEGYIKKGANVRVMQGDAIMYDGKLKTLKHFKEDVSTLDSGNECTASRSSTGRRRTGAGASGAAE